MNRLRAEATGIGSLPFADADTAVDRVLAACPAIPFWPQLPRRDPREGMLTQFCEKLPCLDVAHNDVVVEDGDRDGQLELFYEKVIAQDYDYFAISPDYALGLHAFYRRLHSHPELLEKIAYIKCHITGPFTFAAGIKDAQGVALMHDEIFMQAVVAGLLMKALWQVKFFGRFGKQVIVFFDEPFLGAFGSAYTPLNRGSVVKTLSEMTGALRGAGALSGVHCCGNTDWSIFTDVETLDIINFDAFGFLDKLLLYSRQLKAFLERDGILCWGIVPTQEYSASRRADELVQKIKGGIEILKSKGLDERLLLDRMLISPSCGLGSLDQETAEGILKLLRGTSALLRG